MTETGFIIEHPTRGILMDIDWGHDTWKAKWSWSKPRTEAMWIPTAQQAKVHLAKLPEKLRSEVQIRRFGTWEPV